MSKQGALDYAAEVEDVQEDQFEEQTILSLAFAARDLVNRCGWNVEQVVAAVAEALAPDPAPLTPADDPPF